MQKEFRYVSTTEKDLVKIARDITQHLKGNKIFTLNGNLGAGKTTLVKKFVENITGFSGATSPTFNIMHKYEGNGQVVYHYDLYRIKNIQEISEIGLEEMMQENYVFIEWPEIASNIIKYYQYVAIDISFNKDYRDIVVSKQH
ncbi:MAG: tRNA (adenosine(37)-N6)-threonylcarbamoyltransferase complex ATPase subunit type 1 TsaE [Rickettsiaceae bacterium]|nr:tRNA (adenosine(37)-N6)-threonylcarbamoyltransferase complex ATPase subunit type 1 TsaE [Rickettsiaceae bacterium]